VPTRGGTPLLIAAGRRFQEEQIALDDLGIRRPSLDDVFLTLTGSDTTRPDSKTNGGPG
jgi:ABC-2 type transport system ATP-binding protein